MKMMKKAVSLLLVLMMLFGVMNAAVFTVGAASYDYSAATTLTTDRAGYADSEGQDFRQWLQYDPRWADIKLGSSKYTVGTSGCTITSITKLLIESGFASPTELTPAVIVNWLNNNGGFTSGGNLYWDKVREFCKSELGVKFTLQDSYFMGADGGNGLTVNSNPTYAQMINWIKQGYHLVLQVNKGEHWIAVDEWQTLQEDDGNAYVMDSWDTDYNKRVNLTLSSYLSQRYGMTAFDRIAAYKTEYVYTTDYDTNSYRAYSRYDSRWANSYLDTDGETIGTWGQALLALTKALIQAGVIDENATPLDVLLTLNDKGLISSDGIISWSSMSSYDNDITAATEGSTTATLTASDIIDGLKSGKHYIIRTKYKNGTGASGYEDGTWVTVDEAKTMATGQLYVLTSGTDAGSKSYVTVMDDLDATTTFRVHTFTTAAPDYVKLSFSGTNADVTAAMQLDGGEVSVTSDQYIVANTPITLQAEPATGYSAITWAVSGTAGSESADTLTYTVSPTADTAITATGVANQYQIGYTAVADGCGFTYGTQPETAYYTHTVEFVVNPVTNYEVKSVTAKDADGNDVAVTAGENNTYSFTMPASDVTVTVKADTDRHTVYLDAAAVENGKEKWYAYTWMKVGGADYAKEWITPTLTADGFYEFENVMANVIFVRANNENDNADSVADKFTIKWGQSEDQVYSTNFTDANNLFVMSGYRTNSEFIEGTWQSMLGPNTVYLYPKAIDVRSKDASGKPYMDQFESYPADYYQQTLKEYVAYTWNNASSSQKTWVYATSVDEYGVLQFDGIKDRVQFYRIDPTASAPATSGSAFWNKTKELTVTEGMTDSMYILQAYEEKNKDNADVLGAWDDPTEISGDDYRLWTKNDSRWAYLNLGDQTPTTGNYVGEYDQAQAYIKMILQAGLHEGWDVADFAAHTDSSNNADYIDKNSGSVRNSVSAVYKDSWGFDSYQDVYTYSSSNANLAKPANYPSTIYNYILEGYHVLVRCWNGSSTSGEWVVVDEEKTLAEYDGTAASVYALRTTNNISENRGTALSNIDKDGWISRIIIYKGGTTPTLTRDFDYRRWSIYDPRWTNKVMSTSTYTMHERGALVVALEKMLVQAGVHEDSKWSPLDLYNYVINKGSKFNSDGAITWTDVNAYSDYFFNFQLASDGDYIYLKFDEDITVDNNGTDYTVSGYTRDRTRLLTEADKAVILKAIQQGYHMLLEVSNSTVENTQMWLCIDEELSLKYNDIYIMDGLKDTSLNADKTLDNCGISGNGYTYLYRVVGYKGATTPLTDKTIEDESGEDENDDGEELVMNITSPALLPLESDSSYLGRTARATDETTAAGKTVGTYIYNYIYGPQAQVVVKLDGVAKYEQTTVSGVTRESNIYEICIANTEKDALTFTENTSDGNNTRVLTYQPAKGGAVEIPFALNQYTLYTDAAGQPIKENTIYVAVRSKSTTTKNGTTTTIYSTNALTSSMTYRGFTQAQYVYKYYDRFNTLTTYTVYRNKYAPMGDNELAGYAGNENKAGMPQYIRYKKANSDIASNKLTSSAPDVGAGFNKNLVWNEENAVTEDATYTVELTATETVAKYTVAFSYYDEGGSEAKHAVRGEYNTLITLGDESTVDVATLESFAAPTYKGSADNKFLYWTDDSGSVISTNPAFGMRISEGAVTGGVYSLTYTAVYANDENAVENPAVGDGTWEAKIDNIVRSYKIEGSNENETSTITTVYTDVSPRFIDGNKRIQNLLDADEDNGKVEKYGIIIAYDKTANVDLTDSAATLLPYASLVAKSTAKSASRQISGIGATDGGDTVRFLQYSFNAKDDITNKNRLDIAVPWDYAKFKEQNIVAYSYVVYYKDGVRTLAISDGAAAIVGWN